MRSDGIILTVDDCPFSDKSQLLLDYLIDRGIGAILFCQGEYLEKRPQYAVSAIAEGFVIGNHSYNHPHFSELTDGEAKSQIIETDRIIGEIYAKTQQEIPAKYFRYPYGDNGSSDQIKGGDLTKTFASQKVLQDAGYCSPFYPRRFDWDWDVDFKDWRVDISNVNGRWDRAQIKLKSLKPGDILLTHDHPLNFELRLFQRICEGVQERGFRFCSNEELVEQTRS